VPILYVSHSSAEVARLATTVVALRGGRVAAAGTPSEVLGDVAAVGARGAASVLTARVVTHHADGLSELATAAGRLWLPRTGDRPGAFVRVRIAAQDVILSLGRPEGLSALNVLVGTITEVRPGHGPGAMVTLAVGEERLNARVTRRSAEAMGLATGQICHAVIKTVAVHPEDVGTGSFA
jgi:molybdate transport system ATP-binding protein